MNDFLLFLRESFSLLAQNAGNYFLSITVFVLHNFGLSTFIKRVSAASTRNTAYNQTLSSSRKPKNKQTEKLKRIIANNVLKQIRFGANFAYEFGISNLKPIEFKSSFFFIIRCVHHTVKTKKPNTFKIQKHFPLYNLIEVNSKQIQLSCSQSTNIECHFSHKMTTATNPEHGNKDITGGNNGFENNQRTNKRIYKFAGDVAKLDVCGKFEIHARERKKEKVTCHWCWLNVGSLGPVVLLPNKR